MDNHERRKAPRVPCESLINYSFATEDGSSENISYGHVHCKNISLIGMLFTGFEDISLGAQLNLHLQMDIEENVFEEVNFTGLVVRCDKVGSSALWDIAVNIKTILQREKRFVFLKWLANKDDEYRSL
ncbi:MAG: PilZ domain-containing protein [Candidatus Aureabacteria bacterium]|nr:PilZ domain-containing protein [Candidatus Auribacterota bacterium]